MRQRQLSLLGLILAVFAGVRVVTPGQPASNGSYPGTAKIEKKSRSQQITTHSHPAGVATAGEDCNSDTATAKDKTSHLSTARRGAQPCVSPLPGVWREICKLNPGYPVGDDLLGREDVAKKDFVTRCLGNDRPEIVSVMASVANPRRTHLGLMTDRAIEAIQVAAAEADFLPQSHYLPWPAPPSGSDSQSPPESEDQLDSSDPGVMIFRNTDIPPSGRQKYLLVFLIPELPTEGLDRKVFEAAELIIERVSPVERVSPGKATLLFAGPEFSGSVTSLEEMNGKLVPDKCILAFSGSVTNPPPDPFQNPGCPQPMLMATQTTDTKAFCLFVEGVRTFGYRPEQIAILSEEGTQYGTQDPAPDRTPDRTQDPKQRPCSAPGSSGDLASLRFLHFPREISKLRNAYGAETRAAAQAASANPQTDLQMSWQDSEAARGDDVQTYGQGQTPLSQETVLSTLSITLKAQGIKALGILATDPMDEAFLIHSIKKSSPDIRLFLRDPDLLYLRTPDVATINGTLVVTDNPLIPQNQFWSSTPSANRKRLITFASAVEEDQYNAFILLLRAAKLEPSKPKEMKLLEWGWPAGKFAIEGASQQGGKLRPLWLATIGTAAHYPVKILNFDDVNRSTLALRSLNVGSPQYAPLALWASIAMLGILHVFGLKFHQAVPSALKPDFDLTDRNDTVTLVKISCHLMAILTIALAQMILGSSYLFFYDSGRGYTLLACGVVFVTAFLLWAVGRQVRLLHVLQRQQKQLAVPDEGAKIVDVARLVGGTVAGVSIVVASGIVWLGVTMRYGFENAFLHFRDLNLSSGVALALPIASVLLVMYFGIWAYLRRLAYWEHRYVEMCNLKLDPVIRRDLCVDIAAIDKCLLGPLENGSWMAAFLLTLGACILTFQPWTTLDIVEPFQVWWFVLGYFGLALGTLLLNWFRFINIWVHVRNILEHLENLPIRTAFERLPREKSLPILQWGEARNTFLLRQVLDRLRALAIVDASEQNVRLLTQFESKMDALMKCGVVETEIVEYKNVVGGAPRSMLRGFLRSRQDVLRDAREEMTRVTDVLSARLLEEYWRRGSSGTKEDEKPQPADLKFVLAEDIVALPFYAYIRRVLNELRNLLFFLGIAVSLLFAALHTYAFRADQAIDWWFFGLFAFLGGGIVFIIAQMERNALLSRLSDGTPGELGPRFYLQLLKYGAIPFLTIFGSQVPSISNLVLKWVQPAVEALH